jgi:ATP-binding cassette, subfamily F, member 3
VVSEYFAQDQYKTLDGEARMLDDISGAALRVPEVELRSLLGCFLFRGDDVFKPLGVLSGGERNRYALARILVSPSNFLLLDAIAAFSGTVVFVSHDRYFIDRLATRVIEVENGVITTYPGNYEDYLRKKEQLAVASALDEAISTREISMQVSKARPFDKLRAGSGTPASLVTGATIVIEGGPDGLSDSGNAANKQRRLNPIKQKQMEERCAFLEEEIPRVEASIATTEEQLCVYVSAAETQRLTALAAALREQLDALTAEWEELTLQLEGG